MSHDDSSGEIRLNESGTGVYIDWKNVGEQDIFRSIDEKLRIITNDLGGSYVPNPMWSNMMDKSLVTVHPLGGCPMGQNGRNGVVNHRGQVFIGK